jgi:hypothetical protein
VAYPWQMMITKESILTIIVYAVQFLRISQDVKGDGSVEGMHAPRPQGGHPT